MANKNKPPRITFEVDEETKRRVDAAIPWGFLTPVYQAMTEDLLEMMKGEENIRLILGAIAARKLRLQDFLQLEGDNGPIRPEPIRKVGDRNDGRGTPSAGWRDSEQPH